MAGNHHSPAAAVSGNPQSTQNDVTPATHNQHSGTIRRRRNNRKIETLINAVNFIPFIPKLLIFHEQQENVLKRLGLYNFSKIKLDQSIRPDLIAQVIANYDPKKQCSFVNGKRVRVSRADLARALALPVGEQGVNNINGNVFSDEEIEFVDDFVFNWMLIHEESWVMPEKIVRMTRCVRDGHPEKLDSASLIWCKVERELCLGVKLVDCYYASHLQRLIRSQCERLFEVDEDDEERVVKVSGVVGEQIVQVEDDEVKEDGERIEKVSVVQEDDAELTLRDATMDKQVDLNNDLREQLLQRCQTSDLNNNNNEVKVEDVVDEQVVGVEDDEVKDGEHIEKVSIVQEDTAELTLEHVTTDDQVDLNNNLGEQLQRCQTIDLNNNEEAKVGDVVDEQIEQVEDDEVKEDGECIEKVSVVQEDDAELTLGDATMDKQGDLNNNLREQLLQRCQTSDLNNDEEVKVEDVVDEQIVEEEADEIKEDEEDGEHIKEVSIVQEDGVQLSLGHETVDSTNNSGGQLQLCQTCDFNDNNNNEEVKVEDVVDEQIVQVEEDEVKEDEDDGEHIEKEESIFQEDDVQLTLSHNVELTFGHEIVDELMDSKNNSAEQFLQHSQISDLNNEVKVDEQIVKVDDGNDDGEKFVEGLDMEANDNAIDLVGSRGDSFMSHGGPSFFDNDNNNNNNDNNNNNNNNNDNNNYNNSNNSYNNGNGKRVMESEDDTHYLDMNNKRLKTADIWDHKQSQFGLCMVQMDQWILKAKMISDSKQQIYANHKYQQDSAMNEVQNRQQVMEMIIKSKDEELGKKHAEVYRLERELYLMGDLLSGYRKALNDERIKFSDYRKRAGV